MLFFGMVYTLLCGNLCSVNKIFNEINKILRQKTVFVEKYASSCDAISQTDDEYYKPLTSPKNALRISPASTLNSNINNIIVLIINF